MYACIICNDCILTKGGTLLHPVRGTASKWGSYGSGVWCNCVYILGGLGPIVVIIKAPGTGHTA